MLAAVATAVLTELDTAVDFGQQWGGTGHAVVRERLAPCFGAASQTFNSARPPSPPPRAAPLAGVNARDAIGRRQLEEFATLLPISSRRIRWRDELIDGLIDYLTN